MRIRKPPKLGPLSAELLKVLWWFHRGRSFGSALFLFRDDQFSRSSLLANVAYPLGIFGGLSGSLGLQAGHGTPAPQTCSAHDSKLAHRAALPGVYMNFSVRCAGLSDSLF